MQCYVLTALVLISVSADAAKPRSVNVELDTVFEFEKSSDLDFINKIQGFLNKVKNIIEDTNQERPTRRSKRYKFTDFLEDVINTLKAYTDKDLKETVQVLESEIRKRTQSNDGLEKHFRKLLVNKLGRNKSARNIRTNLNFILRKLQYNKKNKGSQFLGFINSLYKRDSEEKLAKFIRKLKIFRRSSNRKHKDLQDTVRKAVQLIIFDHLSSLSEDTKREAEGRIKDYLNDDFSTNNEIYSRVYKKYDNMHLESELLTQESKERVIPIKKRTKKENTVKTHTPINTNVIFTKGKRGRKKVIKTKSKKSSTLKYSKKKLTHVTLYPESLEIEQNELSANFRATDSDSLVKYGKIKGAQRDKIPEDVLSLSHSAEINVNIKDNEIYNDELDRKSYTLMKVRAFSQKPKKSKNRAYKVQNPAYVNIKRTESLSIPKESVEFFGNLHNGKIYKQDDIDDSKQLDINNIEKNIENVTEFTKPTKFNTVKTSTDIVRNITDSNVVTSRSKFNQDFEKLEYNEPIMKEGYRRANGVNKFAEVSTKLISKHSNASYISNTTNNFESITMKILPITTEKATLKFSQNIKEIDDLNEINSDINILNNKRNITKNHIELQTKVSREPITNEMLTTLLNKQNKLDNAESKVEITETKTTNSTFPVTFDLKSYFKNSEINDIEDIVKKKEIEKKMKEDMDKLFALPRTNATTTEAYTDIFDALDDAFDLTPLN